MREYPIIVTDQDLSRLRGLLGGMSQASILDRGHLSQLQSELDRALVVPCDEVPVGVVTIDTTQPLDQVVARILASVRGLGDDVRRAA